MKMKKGVTGGGGVACAACKYQRRRCTADCLLASYFPPDQPRQFQNAHRLFGVSNIIKILNKLQDPTHKPEAMRSIIYEANLWDRYPVHGCVGEIRTLLFQIHQARLQLHSLNAHLDFYRSHLHLSPAMQLEAASGGGGGDHPLLRQSFESMSLADANSNVLDIGINGIDDVKSIDQLWAANQLSCSNYNSANNISSSNPNMAAIVLEAQPEFGFLASGAAAAQVSDEISWYLDTINEDHHSYIDSKDVYESSLESPLKDTMQSVEHVTENDLKSAAACFTLTSIMS